MKKLFLSILSVVIVSAAMITPVFASENNCVDTGLKGQVCDSGNGDSIIAFLKDAVNILGIGVGALGVLGITYSGVQYLTAGGNEEATKKSKRRIFEIVIGLAVYALLYGILNWLLPEFKGL